MAEFHRNAELLDGAEDIQQKTKDAMLRIQQQTAETESIAEATLEELRQQGEQMDGIHSDLEDVSGKLDETDKLQNRFDRWAGNWLGLKKRAAQNEAAAETAAADAARQKGMDASIREVYECQQYKNMSRKWKNNGLFMVEEPTKPAPDLFDPTIQHTITDSKWQIDFSVPNVDVDGWTYAADFNTLNKNQTGDATASWRHYARRRKWKYIERQSSSSDVLMGIRSRQAQREAGIQSRAQESHQSSKIGFVPRSRQTDMTEGSRSYVDPKDENLDEESQAGLDRLAENDKDIDSMLEQTANSLDRLGGLAAAMGDETASHNRKIEEINDTMQVTMAKQTVVNARQKRLLK